MVKYHLAADGLPKKCRAKKHCPYGSIQDHFNTIEEGQIIGDQLNEELSRQEGFGIATDGNWTVFNKETELTVIKLNNLRVTMKRLENIKKNARQEILNELNNKGVKTLKIPDVATISQVDGATKFVVDTEKLKESGEYDEYSKDVNVSEHTKIETEENAKLKRFEKRMVTPEGKAINFQITLDDDGNAVVNEETENAIRKLKEFEDTLKKAKELEKELKNSLMDRMKENEIEEIKVGLATLKYIPEHKRKIADTKKLQEDNKYSKYAVQTTQKESVRITYPRKKKEE